MTQEELLRLLASIEFPAKYWALCDRFPSATGSSYSGTKDEVLAAFQAVGVRARYDCRDRTYEVEVERIGLMDWRAVFAKQRSGPEFLISGAGPEGRIGSNFAVLVYEAKRAVDPSFSRSPFAGSPPYPRPRIKSSAELAELLNQFIELVREIKTAIRGQPHAA